MPIPLFIDLHQICGWARERPAGKLAGMFDSDEPIVNQWRGLRLTAARRLSRLLGATLFPPRCCLCGFEGRSPDLDLCCFCEADLPWEGAPLPGLTVAMRYEPLADEMIKRLKYEGAATHARVLGYLLAQAVRARGEPLPKLLVPVPLHEARLRERGFNQSLAIARYAGQALGITFAGRAVSRIRDTPSQTGLGVEERHRNVRGAFAVSQPRALKSLIAAAHVAVVDDVTTTGSTLAEMKCLLLAAGVRQVDLWAVARAPKSTPCDTDH
jgi:ComF family protein